MSRNDRASRHPFSCEPTTAAVLCGGETHHIDLKSSGALVLRDHPDLGSERALIALGADPPACLAVQRLVASFLLIASFRNTSHRRIERYDPVLQDRIRTAATIRSQRWEHHQRRDSLDLDLLARWADRLEGVAWDLRGQCRYLASDFPTSPLDFSVKVVWDAPQPSIQPGPNPPFDDSFVIVVNRTWATVWRRDLGVIDGCFVLELVEDGPEPVVLACRSLPGGGVRAQLARVQPGCRLDWLD